jgi:hypothetical protein
MRLNLNLAELHVETTVMQTEFMDGFDGAASVLYDTQTRPILKPTTNSSPCIA